MEVYEITPHRFVFFKKSGPHWFVLAHSNSTPFYFSMFRFLEFIEREDLSQYLVLVQLHVRYTNQDSVLKSDCWK